MSRGRRAFKWLETLKILVNVSCGVFTSCIIDDQNSGFADYVAYYPRGLFQIEARDLSLALSALLRSLSIGRFTVPPELSEKKLFKQGR